MTRIICAGIFVLSASAALAQTGTTSQPAPAAEPTSPAVTQPPADSAQNAGGPANLCQELLAFMKAPEPEPAAAAAPAKPAAPAQQAAPAQEGSSSASAGTAASGDGATAKPESGSNSAQAVSGQDGVATDSPDPSKEKVAAGSVANAPQKDSRTAPTPPADVASTPKDSVLTVVAAEQLASANDVGQCQQAAREMRVAGVAMPPPLIALTALDLQYQQQAGAPAQPSGTADPAASGQGSAPQTPAPQTPAPQ